ncbi:MAG: DUF2341 domain-containing protein [Candidatus Thermoplasmatota archaeon]
MNKKLAILSVAIVICLILGGFQGTYFFGTQFLDTRSGYSYVAGEPLTWWDCNWSYCKKIVIDHTKVAEEQTNFPVLLYRSADSDLAQYAQDDGDDIVFVDWMNRTVQPHEIEKFDGNTGELVVWVKVQLLYASIDTVLYMYYGNPECESQQAVGDVWSNRYSMVHHLKENSGLHYDSTEYNNDGAVYGGVVQGTVGRAVLNGADQFDGIDDVVDCGSSPSLNLTGALTLEAWVMDPPLKKPSGERQRILQIVDKHEEHMQYSSEKTKIVSRTIAGSVNDTIVFACLHTPGIDIIDIMVDSHSVMNKKYQTNKIAFDDLPVELFRKKLPEPLVALPMVAYSKPFLLSSPTLRVDVVFSIQPWVHYVPGSRISYLVFSQDGIFDYESTTHFDTMVLFDWWNPFSWFFKWYTALFGTSSQDASSDTSEVISKISELQKQLQESHDGSLRVIIQLRNDTQDCSSDRESLLQSGFICTAEIPQKKIIAGIADSRFLESIKTVDSIQDIMVDSSFKVLAAPADRSVDLHDFTIPLIPYSGKNVTVCLLDTGVDSSLIPYAYGYDFVNHDDTPFDDHGHGTMVADVLRKIAPNVTLVVAKVLDSQGHGYMSDVLEGLQYCIDQNPDIILFSIGSTCGYTGFYDADPLSQLCTDAVDRGIFVVAAAGNHGSTAISIPACAQSVCSVSAVDQYGWIAEYANKNPTLDLFAPGDNIQTLHGVASGTSLSAGFVAGAAAVLLEAEPDLTPDLIRHRFRSTGMLHTCAYNESVTYLVPEINIENALLNRVTHDPIDYTWWSAQDAECNDTFFEPTATSTVSYYFSGYDAKKTTWKNPSYMCDTNENTCAQTNVNNDIEKLTANQCSGAGSSSIIRVQLRALANKTVTIGDASVKLQPIFSKGTGTNQTLTVNTSKSWTLYADITSDTNAPSPWTWSNVSDLDCNVYAGITHSSSYLCVWEVQIRVTYYYNVPPSQSNPIPGNESTNVPLNTNKLNITLTDADGDLIRYYISTRPNVGSYSNDGLNSTVSCPVSGLKPDTLYTWWVNTTDVSGSGTWTNRTYLFKTQPLSVLNCSTDATLYGSSYNITFTAYAHASSASTIVLLVANSTKRLDAASYTNRESCFATSANVTVSSYPQKITVTIPANENTTWYVKLCDNLSNTDDRLETWNKTYSGRTTGSDYAYSVVADRFGNIYVGGSGSNLNQTTSGTDAWLMKFNASTGVRLWNKTYHSGGTDIIYSVAVDSKGNVYTAGVGQKLNTTTSGIDWWIMKFNGTTGVRLWNKTYNGRTTGNDYAYAVTVDSSDNVYVAGYGSNLNTTTSAADIWIMKFHGTTGVRLWNKTYNGRTTGADSALSVLTDAQGYVYVAGYGANLNTTTSGSDWWIMKFDGSSGARLWNKTYNGRSTGSDQAYALALDVQKNLYITGYGQNLNTTSSSYDVWIMKFNTSTGVRLWNKTYNGRKTGVDYGYSVATDACGKVYVAGAGYNIHQTTSTYDWWLMRFNGTSGVREWNMSHSTGTGSDYLRSVTVDSKENVYLAGYGQNLNSSSTSYDWWIKKLSYLSDRYTVDALKPSVRFVDPTPANNTHLNRTWINISMATSDWNRHYSFVDFQQDLVLWMPMDTVNSTGSPRDLSTCGNHGTKYGDAQQTLNGYFGKAFRFDGSGDYIKRSAVIPTSTSFTYGGWIYWNRIGDPTNGDQDYPINQAGGEFGGPALIATSYDSGNTGELNCWPDENFEYFGAYPINKQTWYHVISVFNGTHLSLYVNGVFIASGERQTPFQSGDFYIGTSSLGGYLNGYVDDVVVFKRALAPSEIRSLYNASLYQYYHNFTGLTQGTYRFRGYDPDRGGNWNQTEEYNITIDTTKPSISFSSPTPDNNTYRNTSWVNISLSTTDTNQHYSFVDFNRSNILWMRMDDVQPPSSYLYADDTEDSAHKVGMWSGDLPNGGYDENWDTHIDCEDEENILYINTTVPLNANPDNVTLTVKVYLSEGTTIDVYVWNYGTNGYSYLATLATGWQNITIAGYSYVQNQLRIQYIFRGGAGSPSFYEDKITWNIIQGSLRDLSTYGHHGSPQGNAAQTISGFYGKAYSFDGTGDYINLNASGLAAVHNQFTISLWVKPTTIKDNNVLYAEWDTGSLDDWLFIMANDGYTEAALKGDNVGGYVSLIGDDINDGVWHHLVFSKNTTNHYFLYIDGTLAMSVSSNEPIPSCNRGCIGNLNVGSSNYYFTGSIDEVLVFNRALHPREILALYNASRYQQYSNITNLADRSYNYAGFAVDRAGNKNHTETRNLTIDTIKPSISFISPPTPPNGTTSNTYVNVSVSSSDSNQQYTFVNINQTCKLWMRMDDINQTGDPRDISSYGNHGRKYGNAAQTSLGYYGKAFRFDGDGDFIIIQNPSLLDVRTPKSFFAWIKTTSSSGTIICRAEGEEGFNPGDIKLYVQGTKVLFQYMEECFIESTITVNDGLWHHVGVTYNGTHFVLYVDGQVDGSVLWDVGETNQRNVTIGVHQWLNGNFEDYLSFFNGFIDEVLIFNRTLDNAEVKSLFQATLYQYQHNFTNLPYKNHTYLGYAVDRAGNINHTETRWRNISQIPIVLTNASTGVKETNATLHGYLVYDGGESCTVAFHVVPPGTTVGGQYPKHRGTPFSYNHGGLDYGTLYKFRAQANNSFYLDYGTYRFFLTKPQEPIVFRAVGYNQTCINLSWNRGSGANKTVIVRKLGSFPTSRTDGTLVYNGTGQWFNDTGLTQKTRYYYAAWSYTTWTFNNGTEMQTVQQWSSWPMNATAATSTLRLLNCSTDKTKYAYNGTVTFSAWVDADVGSTVVLIICDSIENLHTTGYNKYAASIAHSTDTVITKQPQKITATMTAQGNTTWYAKVVDTMGRSSYMKENTTAWNKTFSSTAAEIYDVASDTQGYLYAVGYGSKLVSSKSGADWWIMRFNTTTGVRDWNMTYSSSSEGGADYARSVAVDNANGYVYIVGDGVQLKSKTSGRDWWIIKLNRATGEEIWQKIFSSYTNDYEYARSVTVDSQGNIYVVGSGYNLNGSNSGLDVWIMRFNARTNDLDWNYTYHMRSSGIDFVGDEAYSVVTDTSDNVYVVGCGYGLNGSSSGRDWWIMKFHGTTGARLWNKTYTGKGTSSDDIAFSVTTDTQGHLYVGGYGSNVHSGASSQDWWLMRFNSTTGVREWNKTYSYGVQERIYSVVCDTAQNIYLGGISVYLNGSTWFDWWIQQLNASGYPDVWQWNKTIDGTTGVDYLSALAVDQKNNIYAAGTGQNLNSSSSGLDWWIKKFEHITGNFTTITSNKGVIRKKGMYGLEINAAGTTLYGLIGSSSPIVSATIDTNWHHVALTYDGSTARLYKDGVLVDSDTPFVAVGTTANHLKLGEFLSGKLDEVRISNTARSSAWINTTYLNTYDPESFAVFGEQLGVLSTWTFRKKITLNHSLISSTLSNFPILVYNSSDNDLKMYARSDGSDILFVPTSENWASGTWRNKLDHEIEKFNPTTGELVAWVKIPTLSATTDTEIYMYYNNTFCQNNYQNIAGVWSNNYAMVQHFNETTGSLLTDSTSNNNHGTKIGNASLTASGQIDGAYQFDGNGDYVTIPDSTSLDFYSSGQYTWSMWVYQTSFDVFNSVLSKGKNPCEGGKGYSIDIGLNYVSISNNNLEEEGGGEVGYYGPLSMNTWHFITITYSNGFIQIYVNDSLVHTGSGLTFNTEVTEPTYISKGYYFFTCDTYYFPGFIDELRISNEIRNESWIDTVYNNIHYLSDFLVFGSGKTINKPPVASNPIPTDGATNQNLNPRLSITVNDSNADALTIYFRTNASGSWATIGSNLSVYNGTYSQIPTTMSHEATKYYWSVNLTDGEDWSNHTYSFTTHALYGDIWDEVISSYEFDPAQGAAPCMVRIGTSQYYAIIYIADTADQSCQIITVRIWENNGTIRKSVVSSYTLDSEQEWYDTPYILHVTGDYYAVAYISGEPALKVATLRIWESNGTVQQSIVSSSILSTGEEDSFPSLVHIANDYYAVVYDSATGPCVKTFSIGQSNGTIYGTIISTFNPSGNRYSKMISIGNDLYVISTSGLVTTIRIWSNNGTIQQSPIDTYVYAIDAYDGQTPNIICISDDYHAIAYGFHQEGFKWPGKIITIKIWNNNGTIQHFNASWYLFEESNACLYPTIQPISNSVYGIAYRDAFYKGKIKTLLIYNNGTIEHSIIDTLEFDTSLGAYPSILYIGNNYYAIAYEGPDSDGWLKIIKITTI